MAVSEHEVLGPTLRLQPDGNIGDSIIEAGEASEEVNGERPGGTLHVHCELMRARCRLHPNVLDLLQQVAHCKDFILLAAHRPRADTRDLLQVPPRLWRERREYLMLLNCEGALKWSTAKVGSDKK